jgi:hypothetical protein
VHFVFFSSEPSMFTTLPNSRPNVKSRRRNATQRPGVFDFADLTTPDFIGAYAVVWLTVTWP